MDATNPEILDRLENNLMTKQNETSSEVLCLVNYEQMYHKSTEIIQDLKKKILLFKEKKMKKISSTSQNIFLTKLSVCELIDKFLLFLDRRLSI